MICHPTAIWDYAFGEIDDIVIGKEVFVGAFAEVLVYRRTALSSIEGKLSLGDRCVISTGVNIRAAGGAIRIGAGAAIGQNTVIVAVNHTIQPGAARIYTAWDESASQVDIGANVWIGANCVVLPGASIGDDAVIAAGSVVKGAVPAGELWGGVPARKIKDIEQGPGFGERAAFSLRQASQT